MNNERPTPAPMREHTPPTPEPVYRGTSMTYTVATDVLACVLLIGLVWLLALLGLSL